MKNKFTFPISTDLAINAIRILSVDQIQKANSGHPGLPLGAAPIAFELFANQMNHYPLQPNWSNRDRFILSAGHGSALLYSLFHLFKYGNLSIDDLKNFRQFNSLTPGHPEYKHTIGVEATTGPLGAGLGMAVGMAMAEAHLSSIFNKNNYDVVNHYTYVLCGDGCLMEGISSEVLSLAGTLKLNKLIVLYDSNNISIEGNTDCAFTESVTERMKAFGFQVITVEDANDTDAIGRAIDEAKKCNDKPSFIEIKSIIGYGSRVAGSAKAHGEPLGEDNIKDLRFNLGWDSQESFFIPQEIYDAYDECVKSKEESFITWNKMFDEYRTKFLDMAKLWDIYHSEILEESVENEYLAEYDKAVATRALSGECIQKLANKFPNLLGGSADLGPSNKTEIKDSGFMSNLDYSQKNIHFGVRELGMAAIANGMLLHGGLRTFVATFFVFSDYVKPMARLSSLMKIPQIYVLTHDSIGVGEDGPTHEPIEQLAMLRSMPNFNVIRPADARETQIAWKQAIVSKETPTALVLTRQNIPQIDGTGEGALRGGYIVKRCSKDIPDGIIIATGSELQLAVEAAKVLLKEGIEVNVVSMPCLDIFEQQSKEYKDSILPNKVRRRMVVEAGSPMSWGKYVGLDGDILGISTFGASAPSELLFKKFGFTVENIVARFKAL